MPNFNYENQVELLFSEVELFLDKAIDEDDIDLDYEKSGNLLTISFSNNTKIIINTQAPLKQIWLATKQQGFHFNFKDGDWLCERSNQSFETIFYAAFKQQLA